MAIISTELNAQMLHVRKQIAYVAAEQLPVCSPDLLRGVVGRSACINLKAELVDMASLIGRLGSPYALQGISRSGPCDQILSILTGRGDELQIPSLLMVVT